MTDSRAAAEHAVTERIRAAVDAAIAGAVFDDGAPVDERIRFNPDQLAEVARVSRNTGTREAALECVRVRVAAEWARFDALAQQGPVDVAQMTALRSAFKLSERMNNSGPRTYEEGADGTLVRRDEDL
ncbi:hypothetical protein [Pengzhenrongella sp.]|uniref:hypothetical protein n=1 Tax=Pengzhenrongella sp. TaxID=2888820 RepID=UPI002F928553